MKLALAILSLCLMVTTCAGCTKVTTTEDTKILTYKTSVLVTLPIAGIVSLVDGIVISKNMLSKIWSSDLADISLYEKQLEFVPLL